MNTGVLCAALAVTVALPLAAPAQAWDDWWLGFTCGLSSTNDPTGQVVQDPSTQTGEVDAGPMAVMNAAGGTVHSVTIGCAIKINYDLNDTSNIAAQRSNTTAGNVAVLVDTISYTALPGDDVYLCTWFGWESSKGSFWWYVDDDDDPSNGDQCALATST